jgi:nucleoside-diphosphate-sugar epimerase
MSTEELIVVAGAGGFIGGHLVSALTKSFRRKTTRERRNFSTIAGEKGFRAQTRVF